jgi:hypothetical protein
MLWTKNKTTVGFGPDLMRKYTEINYFVQYQKNNLSIALWIYSIPLG